MTASTQTSLERLREHVAERARTSSVRAIAREVGMSPGGLERFISGGTLYAKTRKKLFEWWQHNSGQQLSDYTSPEVAAAIESLLRDMPPERREQAFASLVSTLGGLRNAYPEACPTWLSDLVEKVPADAGPQLFVA